MKIQEIRDKIDDIGINRGETYTLFDNPSFDKSIIGISIDGRPVYILSKMIEELMQDESWTYDEALEFIEYNTLRALPYIYEENGKPIIVEDLLNED